MSNIVERNNGTGTVCEGVVNGRAGVSVGRVRSISCEILQKRFKLRIASLNVGTMRGRASEIVESLARRRIDICAVQETRWRGCSTRMITGKHCRYKFLWSGDTSGFGGVGILVVEKWIEKIISVDRTSSRQMSLRLLIGRKILYILSSYAPQAGLSESEKDTFFFNLLNCISIVPTEEMLLVCGDLNGHVGKTSSGFEGVHGGHGCGVRNQEGTRILELCAAADLVITNTYFTKRDSQLLTFRSGNAYSQIDYILVRKSDFKFVRDVKVISGEECVSQQKLLVGDLGLNTSFSKSPNSIPPKRKLWKLSNPEVRLQYRNSVHESAQYFQNPNNSDSAWSEIKTCLLNACDTVCGWTWGKEKYLQAKRKAKSAVYAARKRAQEDKFGDLKSNDQRNRIFKEARRMKNVLNKWIL